jgi:hypothetical protein
MHHEFCRLFVHTYCYACNILYFNLPSQLLYKTSENNICNTFAFESKEPMFCDDQYSFLFHIIHVILEDFARYKHRLYIINDYWRVKNTIREELGYLRIVLEIEVVHDFFNVEILLFFRFVLLRLRISLHNVFNY